MAFLFSKFPLFPKLNENGHSWKSLAPNLEQWKIDIFEKIAYIANSLFRTLIFAKFSFVGLLQKILYMQKFRSSKEPKTHFWQQVLILNSRVHFYNWRCFFHQGVVGKKYGLFHPPKQALLVVWSNRSGWEESKKVSLSLQCWITRVVNMTIVVNTRWLKAKQWSKNVDFYAKINVFFHYYFAFSQRVLTTCSSHV